MFCSIHHKNRSMHFLEPILGTNEFRCISGNECQMGAAGSSTPQNNTTTNNTTTNNNNNNNQHQYAPVGSRSFPSPQYDQTLSQGSTDKFLCSEHNKLRMSTFLDQFIQNDGTTGYKCKVGEECKTFGQGGPRTSSNTRNSYLLPYSSPSRSSQLPPFKPGVRPTNYQPRSFDPYASQQSSWPTNHRDPYGQSYRPPYSTYPPHFYSNYNSSHQSTDSRPRQMCAIHGKWRTTPNLVELPTGKWECTANDPCRQSSSELSAKDQGQHQL